MDPPTGPTLMNHTPPYNLSEIWPMPLTNGGGGPGDGLDLRRGPFIPILARFSEPDTTALGSGGAARKRRDNIKNHNNNINSNNNNNNSNNNLNSFNSVDDDSAKGPAMSDSDSKRLKSSGSGDDSQNQKADGEVNSGKGVEQKSKNQSEPPKDYIHVRARRGQATDSHSLAERARREKISERMRILQELVPGCNKVIGKALVLDEIINYIQSLQRQVEFLSMKLEAVNTRISPGIEGFPSKDFGQQPFDTSGVGYCSQPPREYGRGASPDWLHMQIGGGFERQT